MKKAIMVMLTLALVVISAACGKFEEDTVKTEYGDVFTVSFDSFNVKSLITDERTGFSFIVEDKVTEDDFEASTDSQGVVRYKVKDVMIEKKDGSFELVDEGADTGSSVSEKADTH